MFRGIWTGIIFFSVAIGIIVWQGQIVLLSWPPKDFFGALAKAIDVAVLIAVAWEIGGDMLARMRIDRYLKQGEQRGRRKSQREINNQISSLRMQGLDSDEILRRIQAENTLDVLDRDNDDR